MVWVCWDCIWGFVAHDKTTIGGRAAFPVFRACGGLVLLHWFWGISTYVWTRFRVNYIFLFDFNPNIVDSPLAIFNDAVDETLFFLVCMLLYYKVMNVLPMQIMVHVNVSHERLCSPGPMTSLVFCRREFILSYWFYTQSNVSSFR